MAEITAMRNSVLPFPVYGMAYTITFPMLDADGDLVTGATTPDSEISKNGDTFADCTNEATEIATSSGIYYLTLTATEMTADVVSLIIKSATSGMKTTVLTLYPAKLTKVHSGTATAGAAGTITLQNTCVPLDDVYNGCLLYTTGGTGPDQARLISDFVGSTLVASVGVNFATNPANGTTYDIYLTPYSSNSPLCNVTAISGDATAADNCEAQFDGTGYVGGSIKQKVDVDTIKTQTVTCAAGVTVRADVGMASQCTPQTGDAYAIVNNGAYGNSAIKTQLADIHDTDLPAVKSDTGNIKTMTDKIGTITNTGGTATIGAILGDFVNASLVTRVADLHTDVADNHTDIGTALGYIDTEVAAIKSVVDNIHDTDLPAVKTDTAAILADTNELQTDLVNGGRVDLLIDAIKTKTDTLPASPAAVGSAMTLTAAYDAAKTAASQTSVDTIDGIVDAILEDTGTTIPGTLSTIAGYIDTEVADIHTDIGTVITNVADLHTDVGTVITNLATVDGIIDNIHDTDLPSVKSDTAAILADTGTDGVVVAAASKTGYALSSAGVQAIWDALTSALTTAGSVGKRIVDYLTGDIFARIGAPAGASVSADIADLHTDVAHNHTDITTVIGYIDTEVAAIKAKTDNLPASPAAVGSAMTLTAAYDAAKTAASQTSVDTIDGIADAILEDTGTTIPGTLSTIAGYIDTEVADIHMDIGTVITNVADLHTDVGTVITNLATVDGIIDNIHDTDLPAVKSDTAAILSDTNELQTDLVNGGRLDLLIDAIKAKTDNLPASPAAVGSAMTLTADYDAAKTAAQAGDKMDIVDTPNATAVTAIQDGLSTFDPAADTVTVGTNNDKTGYTLSTAGVSAVQSGLSTLTAQQVWEYATRTLSSFGTLASEIWGNATRTLTAISDSAGVTTLLSRISAEITITGGKVDVNDKTGFVLTSAYDAAKTAAQAGGKMDIVDTPNATAVTAIQDGLSTFDPATDTVTVGTMPTAAEIREELDTNSTKLALLDVAVSTRTTMGTGRIPYEYTLTDTMTGLPISGATVRASTDNAEQNVVAEGITNSFGKVIFRLEPGRYYYWRYDDDHQYNNPDVEDVA
jgi:hypothetical protein